MTKATTRRATVLVIDDEPGICRALSAFLTEAGHTVLVASNAEESLRILGGQRPDLALVDLRLPGMDGVTLMARMKLLRPEMPAVLITAFGGTDVAIQAAQAGAYAYLPKPFDLDDVTRLLDTIMARLPAAVLPLDSATGPSWELLLRGSSAAARDLRERIEACSRSGAPVLFVGEVGSGKEIAARSLHALAGPVAGPFHPVRCSSLDEDEIDAALAELAGGAPGFWFLVEMGDLDSNKVASVLRRVPGGDGGSAPRLSASVRLPGQVDTEVTPLSWIEEAKKRGWSLVGVPPLRARLEDLRDLTAVFLGQANLVLDRKIRGLDGGALEALAGHAWPGNLRELENAVRSAALATRGDIILRESLPVSVRPGESRLHDPLAPAEPIQGKTT